MDYIEFIERIGKFKPLSGELKDRLIHGLDSIHFVAALGIVEGENYKITISESMMKYFCDIVSLIENRGAVRSKDYIIGCEKLSQALIIGIHTTHSFLSDEDLDVSIRRYYSR